MPEHQQANNAKTPQPPVRSEEQTSPSKRYNSIASQLAAPNSLSSSDILQLQQTIGNQAVMQLLKNSTHDTTQLANDASSKTENNTGLPDSLKNGVESLSGYDMNDVKVHYNSSRPDQLGAAAYTQGSEIHVAHGQERHLAHEAWHIVQQKQGRVRPTVQMKGLYVNDDAVLENEADQMGEAAKSHIRSGPEAKTDNSTSGAAQVMQMKLTELDDELKGAARSRWHKLCVMVDDFNNEETIEKLDAIEKFLQGTGKKFLSDKEFNSTKQRRHEKAEQARQLMGEIASEKQRLIVKTKIQHTGVAYGGIAKTKVKLGLITSLPGDKEAPPKTAKPDEVEEQLDINKQLKTAIESGDMASFSTILLKSTEAQLGSLRHSKAFLTYAAKQLTDDGYALLAASIMIKARHAPGAMAEGIRVLSAMLMSKEVARRMLDAGVQVVIIPRNKRMTEVSEFASLKGQRTRGDGRPWQFVRGIGSDPLVTTEEHLQSIAITEENLLGGNPDPRISQAPFEKVDGMSDAEVTAAAQGAKWGYNEGYSTSTHEFAHSIHLLGGLDAADKKIITKNYKKLYSQCDTPAGATDPNKWPDGPCVSPTAEIRPDDISAHPELTGFKAQNLSNAWRETLGRYKYECYAAQHEQEYFAQLTNAYLGTNTGTDPYTNSPRNNGREWVAANQPKEMLKLLDRLYKRKKVNETQTNGQLTPGGTRTNKG